MIGTLHEKDKVIEGIETLRDDDEDHRRRLSLLRWLSTRVMRRYHQDVWDVLHKSSKERKLTSNDSQRKQMRILNRDTLHCGKSVKEA